MNNDDIEYNQIVLERLYGQFRSDIERHEVMNDMLCILVRKEIIPELMLYLHNDATLNYNFLTTLCGMHYPDSNLLGVVYHLHSFKHNHRIRVKATTNIQSPTIPTITGIWPAANWLERETYDFFGIVFEGHPNLKRILNMDDMIDFPLRKDFPLEDQTRLDKDDSLFGR